MTSARPTKKNLRRRKRWKANKSLGLKFPDEVLDWLDLLPDSVSKTNFCIAAFALLSDAINEDAFDELIDWVELAKLGHAEQEFDGLAKRFADSIIASRSKKQ